MRGTTRDDFALYVTPPAPPAGRRHALRFELRARGLKGRHWLSYWHAGAGYRRLLLRPGPAS